MNELDYDTIDNIQEYVNLEKIGSVDITLGFDERIFYINFIENSIRDYVNGSMEIDKDSIFYIFILLNAKPYRSKKYLEENYMFYKESRSHRAAPKTIFKDRLSYMLQFINLSFYLCKYTQRDNFEQQHKEIVEILTIVASTEYESLYSPRGKYEFAYYFKKFLTLNKDACVTPYKSDSWRGEFLISIKNLKSKIDNLPILEGNDRIEPYYISNMAITLVKGRDKNLPNLGERYRIAIGTIDHKILKYEQIVNTNFK